MIKKNKILFFSISQRIEVYLCSYCFYLIMLFVFERLKINICIDCIYRKNSGFFFHQISQYVKL